MSKLTLQQKVVGGGIVTLVGGVLLAATTTSPPLSLGEQYARDNGNKICYVLTFYPDADGVAGLISAVYEKGKRDNSAFSHQDAGKAVWDSVHQVCPTYIPALDLFIAKYGDAK